MAGLRLSGACVLPLEMRAGTAALQTSCTEETTAGVKMMKREAGARARPQM